MLHDILILVVGLLLGAVIGFFWVMWPTVKNTIGKSWSDVSNKNTTKATAK